MGCGTTVDYLGGTNPWDYWRDQSAQGNLTPSWSTSSGGSSSSSSSSNYSGLPADYRERLLQATMPTLESSVSNMVGNADKYANEANAQYSYLMNQALLPAIREAIGSLANRGVLSSTVAGDAIGKVASDAATQAGEKGYETAMKAALMKYGIPEILSSVLNLGQYSQGSSSSASISTNKSYSEDPSSIWNLMYGE